MSTILYAYIYVYSTQINIYKMYCNFYQHNRCFTKLSIQVTFILSKSWYILSPSKSLGGSTKYIDYLYTQKGHILIRSWLSFRLTETNSKFLSFYRLLACQLL